MTPLKFQWWSVFLVGIDCFGALSQKTLVWGQCAASRRLLCLFEHIWPHECLHYRNNQVNAFLIPLEVVKNGQAQNILDAVYTCVCQLVYGLTKIHLNARCEHHVLRCNSKHVEAVSVVKHWISCLQPRLLNLSLTSVPSAHELQVCRVSLSSDLMMGMHWCLV